MKKAIGIFFLALSLHMAWGQDEELTLVKQADSIQKITDSQQQTDTTKIIRLNLLAKVCFLGLQFEKGLTTAREARKLAANINYPKGEALYLQTLANFHLYSRTALYFFAKSYLAYNQTDYPDNITDFTSPDFTEDYLKRANTRLAEALAFFEKKQDKEFIAHTLYRITAIYLWLGRPAEALPYLNRAAAIFKELKQDALVVQLLVLKISNANEMGEKQNLNTLKTEARHIISGIGDFRDSALVTYLMCRDFEFDYGVKTEAIGIELKIEAELERRGEDIIRLLVLEDMAVNFGYIDMSQKSIDCYKESIAIREKINWFEDAIRINFNVGFELVNMNKLEEAKLYFSKAKALVDQIRNPKNRQDELGRYDDAMGQILMGEKKYREALAIFQECSDNPYIDFYIANCYQKLGNIKESIRYGEMSYDWISNKGYTSDQRLTLKTVVLLSEVYEQTGQQNKAHQFLKKYRKIIKQRDEDNIANYSSTLEVQALIEKSQQEKELLEKEKLVKDQQNQNQRWWLISIAGALLSTFVVLFVIYRNYYQKQKANRLLQQQKEKVEHTLQELKSTQAQLIQSEKMASLGQLTAGIAHEIQNPLNFVNNFAEVNKELISEMKTEIGKGNLPQIEMIASDIESNSEKINHHGRRADSIVKGMLQHSQIGTGIKEPTNINALAGEYLRLCYNGLRAKDQSVNVMLKTDFDEKTGIVKIIPQEIGRVLLNLYNNAFYAVNEKAAKNESGYEPVVSVSTHKTTTGVVIKVTDNGDGIPQNIVANIFQPFFTTKPTGQGIGLGLSLSYDIIKAHGGEIKAESTLIGYTQFTIVLPA